MQRWSFTQAEPDVTSGLVHFLFFLLGLDADGDAEFGLGLGLGQAFM